MRDGEKMNPDEVPMEGEKENVVPPTNDQEYYSEISREGKQETHEKEEGGLSDLLPDLNPDEESKESYSDEDYKEP